MRYTAFLVFAIITFSACGGSSETSQNTAGNSNADHSQMDHAKMDHSQIQSSPAAADAPYDLQFIDTMIAHHQGAVDMAKLADALGGDPVLKKFAKAIIDAQEREITQMKRWRKEWFKDAKPAINVDLPGMREGMAGMDMKKLGELKGADLDREFLRQMITHHEGAIKMSGDILSREKSKNSKPELKKLAETISKHQKAEIEYMKKLLEPRK